MSTPTRPIESPSLSPLAAFAFAKPRRRSRLLPWLLFALIWGVTTALLVLSADAAPLIAAYAG